ncbi:MAG: DUF4358 domain-containing protein [Clostridia bacterium]|nr:DUF4358 domain-containing protein [Clostridia bacterium]
MKKIISAIICITICICCFASCSGTKTAVQPLSEVYAGLEGIENMPEMEIMPDSLIETLFGFNLADFEEYVFAEAADPSVYADAIILIKLADGADLNATCETLDGYLRSVADNTQSYSPENYAKTNGNAVCVIGDYVYLVITSEYQQARQLVDNALHGGNIDSAVQTLVNPE